MNSEKPIPRVGVGIVIRRGDEVLLMRRRNVHGAGTWSTPGGYLEYGESPEECAAREAMEETGVTVGPVRFLGMTNDLFEDRGKHFITLWMTAPHGSGEGLCTAPDESSEVAWFPHRELPEPLFLCLENLIRQCDAAGRPWFE